MNQNDAILAHLKAGNELTPLDALNRFGCLRLAARIADLREAGYQIDSRIHVTDGKRFAAYRLCANAQGEVMQ